MKITGIIPARYASTRLPGKALERIGPKTMIEHVYQGACGSEMLDTVLVATDHPDIFAEVQKFGGRVIMTSPDHASGTDRCFEAFQKAGGEADFIINIQGDEPFIDPGQIDLLASMCNPQTELATLVLRISSEEELFNPNVVKVVRDASDTALYFSRAAIPAHRDPHKEGWLEKAVYYKHIGMYAYRRDVLEKITKLSPGMLETAESLEQLRWLEAGYRIKVGESAVQTMGIDTPEDLEAARQLYAKQY